MTTLLLVFVCLRIIAAAVAVELSGTCPGVRDIGTEPCAALWSQISIPKICSVYTQGFSLWMAAVPLADLVLGEPGRQVQTKANLWGN